MAVSRMTNRPRYLKVLLILLILNVYALVTNHNFDTNGNYNIKLQPGTYVVKTKTGINFYKSVTISIENGKTTTLDFDIDTGIR